MKRLKHSLFPPRDSSIVTACFLKQQVYNFRVYKRHISGADERVFGSGFKQPRPNAFKRAGVFQRIKAETNFPIRKFIKHGKELFFL